MFPFSYSSSSNSNNNFFKEIRSMNGNFFLIFHIYKEVFYFFLFFERRSVVIDMNISRECLKNWK